METTAIGILTNIFIIGSILDFILQLRKMMQAFINTECDKSAHGSLRTSIFA